MSKWLEVPLNQLIVVLRNCRADHWDLKNPSWVGRIRIITIGPKCVIKLEDKTTGKQSAMTQTVQLFLSSVVLGELFAECPIENYPAPNIDPVIDSSRYFVLKVVNGMGELIYSRKLMSY